MAKSSGKSHRVKTQRVNTSETSWKKKCSPKIFRYDFSEDRRYHFYWILEYLWIPSKSSRDCFLLKSFRMYLPSGFLLGRHVCRTKLPTKNFEIDTKNGLKNAKKDPKKDPKRDRNIFSPLRPL